MVVVCTVILLPFGAGHYGQANRRIGYFAVRSTVAMFGGTSLSDAQGRSIDPDAMKLSQD